MKLILHSGMGKTGTSALQVALHRNKEALLERGVLYPELSGPVSHSDLTLLVMKSRHYPFPRGFRRVPTAELDERRELAREKLLALKSPPSGVEIIILSTEYIFYLTRESQLELKELLMQITPDIQTCAWIRPPISYYFSLMSQRAKAIGGVDGAPPINPTEFTVGLREKITTLQEVWPTTRFYPYVPEEMVNADILPDFIAKELPDLMDLDITPVRHNISKKAKGAGIENRREMVATLKKSCADDIRLYNKMFRGGS
ncbi:hypothetical protein [Coralliovum pocilloporae]|uniref:hypothetical protein n=1 Tax=Coralliovum pocilloporae TaxID=3066369 RepID=UPI00330737DA